jgi:signal transduction histidine kinase
MRFGKPGAGRPVNASRTGRQEPQTTPCDNDHRPGALEEVTQLRHEVSELLGETAQAPLGLVVTRMLGQLEQDVRQEGQFVSDVSHELRTPLAGLRARLEDAQLDPGEAGLRDVLGQALRDVDRLEAIVTDLLLLARLRGSTSRALETVDLAELVRADVARRTDRLKHRLQLEQEVTVDVVRTQISRVFTNLMDNAQRHGERMVDVEVRRAGDRAELIVADDGAGVAQYDRAKIFERFARLPASRLRDSGGTGLGLAIAREVAHAHSGTLHVEDSATGGACFVLRLPLSQG